MDFGRSGSLERLLGQATLRAPVDHPKATRRIRYGDVVGDGELENERKLLENADDAGAIGGGGGIEGDFRAVEHDATRVPRDDAGEDLDEGGLTRAVLAENGVNASREDGEIRVGEGAHAPVALGNALHAQDRRGRRLRSVHAANPCPLRSPWSRDAPASREPPPRNPKWSAAAFFRLLLVLLRLPNYFSCAEVDVAGREGVADEEIVAELRVIVHIVLEVGIFGQRQRKLYCLRHDLALKRRDRGQDRNCDLRRSAAARSAFQAITRKLGAKLAKAVLSLAAERSHRLFGVEHRLHHARVAALSSKAVKMLLHGDRIRGHLLRRGIVPPAEHLDAVR